MNIPTYNDDECANKFCDYFSSISAFYAASFRPHSEIENGLFAENIKVSEIKNCVDKLNLRKAAGPDNVSPFMIKRGGKFIIDALYLLFNKIYKSSIMPKIFKIAQIIPIPKEKNTRNIKEFRPISLISVVGKLLEKIITNRLKKYVEINNIIPEKQFGFRSGSSTINPITKLQDDIIKA